MEISIEEAIKKLGLPNNSKFLGYVIHLPEKDEFIALIEDNEMYERTAFSQTPELAKIYDDYHEALKDAESCKYDAEPCLIFESDDKFLIASPE